MSNQDIPSQFKCGRCKLDMRLSPEKGGCKCCRAHGHSGGKVPRIPCSCEPGNEEGYADFGQKPLLIFIPIISILLLATSGNAAALSDTLPLTGRFSQGKKQFSSYKVEKFLLTQDTCKALVNQSRIFKWTGHAIGAGLWAADIAVSAYQLKLMIDALKDQNNLLDTTGKQIPFSNDLNRFTVPLLIGSQIATFTQARFYNRADFLLHQSALAYNASLAMKHSKDTILDLRISKVKGATYQQSGLFMTEPLLHCILREEPASRTCSIWSMALNETGNQISAWGGMYLGLAIMSYLQEAADTSFIIDRKARKTNLNVGISLTSVGIVGSIIAHITKKVAIDKYNQAKPVGKIQSSLEEQGIIEEQTSPSSDSTAAY